MARLFIHIMAFLEAVGLEEQVVCGMVVRVAQVIREAVVIAAGGQFQVEGYLFLMAVLGALVHIFLWRAPMVVLVALEAVVVEEDRLVKATLFTVQELQVALEVCQVACLEWMTKEMSMQVAVVCPLGLVVLEVVVCQALELVLIAGAHHQHKKWKSPSM